MYTRSHNSTSTTWTPFYSVHVCPSHIIMLPGKFKDQFHEIFPHGIQIPRTCFVVFETLIIWGLYILAHVTADLWWHVQNYETITKTNTWIHESFAKCNQNTNCVRKYKWNVLRLRVHFIPLDLFKYRASLQIDLKTTENEIKFILHYNKPQCHRDISI